MTIQQRIEETNQAILALREKGKLTRRVLAVGIEINQKYTEYLDTLLDSDLSQICGVTVELDGQRVHFPSRADFEEWLAERLS